MIAFSYHNIYQLIKSFMSQVTPKQNKKPHHSQNDNKLWVISTFSDCADTFFV